MSKICDAAEQKAKELGIYLSTETTEHLSTYNDNAQVRWIANPLMEWLLQRCTNQLLANRSCAPTVQTGQTTAVINDKQPLPNPDPIPEPDPDPDPDDENPIGFSIFD